MCAVRVCARPPGRLLGACVLCAAAALALLLGAAPALERRAHTRAHTERTVAHTPAAFVLPGPVNAGLVRRTDRATDTFADERSLHMALYAAAYGTRELTPDARDAVLRARLRSPALLRPHVRTMLELCDSGRLSLDYVYWTVRSAALLGVAYDRRRVAALAAALYDGRGGFRIAAGTGVAPSLAGTYYATALLAAIDDGTLSYTDEPLGAVHRRVLAHIHPAGGFADAAREQTWLRPAPHIVHVRRALHTLVLARANATATGAPRRAVAPAYRAAAAFLRACYAPDGGFLPYPPSLRTAAVEGVEDENAGDTGGTAGTDTEKTSTWEPSRASDTAEGLMVAAMLRDYDATLVDAARVEEARRYLSLCAARGGRGVLAHASAAHLSLEAAQAVAALNSDFVPARPVLLRRRTCAPAVAHWAGVVAALAAVLLLYGAQLRGAWLRGLLARAGAVLAGTALVALAMAVLPQATWLAVLAGGLGLFAAHCLRAQGRGTLALDRTRCVWVLVVAALALLPHVAVLSRRPFLLAHTAWYAAWNGWCALVCFAAGFATDCFAGARPVAFVCGAAATAWAATLLCATLSVLCHHYALVEHLALATGELYLIVTFVPATTFTLMQIAALLGASLALDPRVASSRLRRFIRNFASAR